MVEKPMVTLKLRSVYVLVCENFVEYASKNLFGIIPKIIGFYWNLIYYTYIIFVENDAFINRCLFSMSHLL